MESLETDFCALVHLASQYGVAFVESLDMNIFPVHFQQLHVRMNDPSDPGILPSSSSINRLIHFRTDHLWPLDWLTQVVESNLDRPLPILYSDLHLDRRRVLLVKRGESGDPI
ncbi:unnamed protein product [Protopolystoma xenopodis]|uniref:Uncharacterized protein n=1 Tax=Protopolystoma xenopodis TaxID=117903 RepID=A0A3S5CEY8_9PLAT|nr:unnamed protein product [Protopolystoma xenopodis]